MKCIILFLFLLPSSNRNIKNKFKKILIRQCNYFLPIAAPHVIAKI